MKYFSQVNRILFTITANIYAVPKHIDENLLFDEPVASHYWRLPFWKWVFNHKEYVKYKLWARQDANAWSRNRIDELKEDDRLFNLQMKFNGQSRKTNTEIS